MENNLLFKQIEDKEYFECRTHYNRSRLWAIKNDPNQWFREWKNTESKDFGTAFHCWILEPHKFDEKVMVIEAGKKKTAAIKEQAFLEGKALIRHSDLALIKTMLSNLKQTKYWPLLQNFSSLHETTCTSTIKNIPICVKYDSVNPDERIIIDIKTTRYASHETDSLTKAIYNYGYYFQAYLQRELLKNLTGEIYQVVHIFISKEDGIARPLRYTEPWFDLGRECMDKVINNLEYLKSVEFNPGLMGYTYQSVEDISPQSWMK